MVQLLILSILSVQPLEMVKPRQTALAFEPTNGSRNEIGRDALEVLGILPLLNLLPVDLEGMPCEVVILVLALGLYL